MKSWLDHLLRQVGGLHKPAVADRRVRPSVELLENRLVPSGVPTFTVTTALDTAGHLGMSLRDAVNAANTNADPGTVDVINFAPGLSGQTIALKQGVLDITQSVKIVGLGAGKLTIDGGGNGVVGGEGGSQIFNLVDGAEGGISFTVQNLKLAHGNYFAQGNTEVDGGGAIGTTGNNRSDSLTVQNCIFTNNVTNGVGGAIAVHGAKLTVQDSVLAHNVSGNEGGAISFDSANFANDTVLIERTLFANNSTQHEQGGGLSIQGGLATINRCDFSGNVSGNEGGAIASRSTAPNSTIQNTTIAGNVAGSGGGGIWIGTGTLTLRNDTITQNKTTNEFGGGVWNQLSNATNLFNTIVEGNVQGKIANDISSFGGEGGPTTFNVQYSLIQAPAAGTILHPSAHHDIIGVPAQLVAFTYNAPLASYTLYALTNTSPALKSGNAPLAAGLSTDEIGNPRTHIIHGVTYIDMGAIETNLAPRRLHL